jgi:transcriptional regulator with XRE-family HTH domain
MNDPYSPQNEVGMTLYPDVSGSSYPRERSTSLVPHAALALALAVPLSSSSARPEEHWAAVFPQYSTVLSDDQPLPLTAERLAAVQTLFGLSKTQLARVCGVSRQTVYDWYAGNFEAEGANAQRLAHLYDIAEKLQLAGCRPLSARNVLRALASGNTLLEMLASDVVDRDEVGAVVAQLERATLSQRSRGAAAIRERLGWPPTSKESAEAILEANLEDFVDG